MEQCMRRPLCGTIQPHQPPYVTRSSHRPTDHVYLCELHADLRVHSAPSDYGLEAPSRCLHFWPGQHLSQGGSYQRSPYSFRVVYWYPKDPTSFRYHISSLVGVRDIELLGGRMKDQHCRSKTLSTWLLCIGSGVRCHYLPGRCRHTMSS